MKRLGGIVLAAALAGCGAEPPDRSRLAEGSEAVVYEMGSTVVRVTVDGDEYKFLDVGGKAMVMSDKSDASDLKREVLIVPDDGEHKGKLTRISRSNLRPR